MISRKRLHDRRMLDTNAFSEELRFLPHHLLITTATHFLSQLRRARALRRPGVCAKNPANHSANRECFTSAIAWAQHCSGQHCITIRNWRKRSSQWWLWHRSPKFIMFKVHFGWLPRWLQRYWCKSHLDQRKLLYAIFFVIIRLFTDMKPEEFPTSRSACVFTEVAVLASRESLRIRAG